MTPRPRIETARQAVDHLSGVLDRSDPADEVVCLWTRGNQFVLGVPASSATQAPPLGNSGSSAPAAAANAG